MSTSTFRGGLFYSKERRKGSNPISSTFSLLLMGYHSTASGHSTPSRRSKAAKKGWETRWKKEENEYQRKYRELCLEDMARAVQPVAYMGHLGVNPGGWIRHASFEVAN